ncbi:MAG: hypothetical protein E6J85_00625 [Deltaproteobacteria bacterium]|nr:MAG: hypothetical protein E6J85_00625 [Deltaproteobacteria bacterium]
MGPRLEGSSIRAVEKKSGRSPPRTVEVIDECITLLPRSSSFWNQSKLFSPKKAILSTCASTCRSTTG